MGFFPVTAAPYDAEYWQKYVGYADTVMGRAITAARVELVKRYAHCHAVVDVGIGCGAFIEARDSSLTYGFDINPVAVEWLEQRGMLLNPYESTVYAATFWDAIEHISDAHRMLANVERFAFMTVPIIPGNAPPPNGWRHFRPDEHCFYWTRNGLIAWMGEQGFTCREHNTMESLLGREDANTFVFERYATT
jgi:hypothetical protein